MQMYQVLCFDLDNHCKHLRGQRKSSPDVLDKFVLEELSQQLKQPGGKFKPGLGACMKRGLKGLEDWGLRIAMSCDTNTHKAALFPWYSSEKTYCTICIAEFLFYPNIIVTHPYMECILCLHVCGIRMDAKVCTPLELSNIVLITASDLFHIL